MAVAVAVEQFWMVWETSRPAQPNPIRSGRKNPRPRYHTASGANAVVHIRLDSRSPSLARLLIRSLGKKCET